MVGGAHGDAQRVMVVRKEGHVTGAITLSHVRHTTCVRVNHQVMCCTSPLESVLFYVCPHVTVVSLHCDVVVALMWHHRCVAVVSCHSQWLWLCLVMW